MPKKTYNNYNQCETYTCKKRPIYIQTATLNGSCIHMYKMRNMYTEQNRTYSEWLTECMSLMSVLTRHRVHASRVYIEWQTECMSLVSE